MKGISLITSRAREMVSIFIPFFSMADDAFTCSLKSLDEQQFASLLDEKILKENSMAELLD